MGQAVRGLDFEFLDYFDVTLESQRPIQGRYVELFGEGDVVVDLACGTGDFLHLLREKGIKGLGVDLDPECCEIVRDRGLEIVQADVLDYLRRQPAESVDGIFSAHLVEHLPFDVVVELFQEGYRVLRPGGRMVTVTPNVRSLYAHLDMFYKHFGHVTFYHPELLEFFSRHVGFEEVTSGENEVYSKPLLRDVEMEFPRSMSPERDRFPELVKRPANIWARPYWLVKRFMVRLFVKPYVDHLHSEILDLREVVREMIEAHNRLIDVVDRPFEAFIIADKLGDGDAAGNQ